MPVSSSFITNALELEKRRWAWGDQDPAAPSPPFSTHNRPTTEKKPNSTVAAAHHPHSSPATVSSYSAPPVFLLYRTRPSSPSPLQRAVVSSHSAACHHSLPAAPTPCSVCNPGPHPTCHSGPEHPRTPPPHATLARNICQGLHPYMPRRPGTSWRTFDPAGNQV